MLFRNGTMAANGSMIALFDLLCLVTLAHMQASHLLSPKNIWISFILFANLLTHLN
jgi:hypothetical protein